MSKRVRFSNNDQVHVLPDTMKTSTREEDEQVERLAGDYKRLKTGGDVQSEIAAEAANISRENRRRRAGRGQSTATDLLGDIEQAEEDTQPLAENDNEEIPLEPFNLKREREEGSFSADGYWEEKKQEKKQPVGKFNERGEYVVEKDEDEDEEADAWVDSLQDVKVDEALASKLRQEQEQAAKAAAYQDDELDAEDKAIYKRRIASLLNEGETVLSALRRLGGGGRQDRGKDSRRGRRQKGKGATGGAAEGDAGAAGAGSSSSGGGGSSMSTENKAAFNKLTELADGLLSNGEYNIYSMTREDLGGGPPEAASSSGGPPEGASVGDGSKESVGSIFANAVLAPAAGAQPAAAAAADEDMDDMFGDEDGAAPAAGERAGTSGGAAAAAAAAPAAASGSGERATGAAPAQGPPAAGSGPGSAAVSSGGSALEGFQYDEGSGYYYNSQLGYWYDSSTGLYGDASTGLWYSYADGQYTLVDTPAAESQATPVAG